MSRRIDIDRPLPKPAPIAVALSAACACLLLAAPTASQAKVRASVAGRLLTIEGGRHGNRVKVLCDAAGNVKINARDPRSGAVACSTVAEIDVLMGRGKDRVDLTGVNSRFGQTDFHGFGHGTGCAAKLGAGDDTYLGCPSGFNLVDGGPGDDRITGGDAADLIYGDPGNDAIRGLGGKDVLVSGKGNDRIFGGSGDDVIEGGPGGDVIRAGPGDDVIVDGPGDDRVFTGPGDDKVFAGPGHDRIFAGPNDQIHAGSKDMVIRRGHA